MAIHIRKGKELDGMRAAGAISRDVLLKLVDQVEVGVTTGEIDQMAADLIAKEGCVSAFLNYSGFPGHICISVNEEVVHGIGGKKVIKDGDIVKIDVGVIKNGWIGDNATTVPVGNVSEDVMRLLQVTEDSLDIAIDHARDGKMLGDLCASVERCVVAEGFTVVREYIGHGVGKELHEEPQVPNFGTPGAKPRLKAGMILAIEPMVNLGAAPTITLNDKWTVITADRKPSAHFEHTVLVTKGEPEILTARERLTQPNS